MDHQLPPAVKSGVFVQMPLKVNIRTIEGVTRVHRVFIKNHVTLIVMPALWLEHKIRNNFKH